MIKFLVKWQMAEFQASVAMGSGGWDGGEGREG